MKKSSAFTILFIWWKTRSHIINHYLIYKTFLTVTLFKDIFWTLDFPLQYVNRTWDFEKNSWPYIIWTQF